MPWEIARVLLEETKNVGERDRGSGDTRFLLGRF